MLQEIIPFLASSDSTLGDASRSKWTSQVQQIKVRAASASEQFLDHFAEEPRFVAQPYTGETGAGEETKKEGDSAAARGHSLFEELFFFCRVKKVGDLPEAECIYVETVVDRDSGLAFAKVYPTKSARNAVDILETCVMPIFERSGISIQEIHTRKTSEYWGLLPVHPFETFLATSHIQHLEIGQASRPYNFLCEQFYTRLLKDFFPVALRRSFQLTLAELQVELDSFLETHNTALAPAKRR